MSEATGTTVATPAYPTYSGNVSDYRSLMHESKSEWDYSLTHYTVAGWAADIWNEAHAENQFRSDSFPATFVRDVAEAHALALDEKITRVLRAEFPGALPDSKEAKLRKLVSAAQERDIATARVRALEVELGILKTAPITDMYDERVVHIWEAAAIKANDEGYCGEYDRIADATGIPTRSELAGRGFRTTSKTTRNVDLEVRVHVTVQFDLTDDEAEDFDITDHSSLVQIDRLVRDQVDVGSWDDVEFLDINED